MAHYANLTVRFGPHADGGVLVSVSGPGGEAEALAPLPPALLPDRGHPSTRAGRTEPDPTHQIGHALFSALFCGAIRDVYTRSQGRLADLQRLRIIFAFPSYAHDLAALPWEHLHDPDRGALALRGVSIVRTVPQQRVLAAVAAHLPLRALLTAADTPPVSDLGRELAQIGAALAQLDRQVETTVLAHCTPAQLQEQLRTRYHIWHFIGHGGRDAHGVGTLRFEDPTGDPVTVTAPQLAALLDGSGVQLILLNACGSGQAPADSVYSLAAALLTAGVPAIVAMRAPIAVEQAQTFSRAFYQTLVAGFPLDDCMAEGRKALMLEVGDQASDWGTPVLYSRAAEGDLFALTPAIQPSADAPFERLYALAAVTDRIWPRRMDDHHPIGRARDLGAPHGLSQAIFRVGERIQVTLEAGRSGSLLLLDQGPTGQVYCLCPSQFAQEPAIGPDLILLPQHSSPYRAFQLSGAPGRERLLAIVSDQRLDVGWPPIPPHAPAHLLSPDEIMALEQQLQQLPRGSWVALATSFDVVADPLRHP